jgi:selenocysteine lyase/cysteine desulfurase
LEKALDKIDPLLSSDMFVGIDGIAHLCTGGEGPWLRAQEDVYRRFAKWKSQGHDGRDEIYRVGDACREKMGQLWDVPGNRVAFVQSAAEGMGWLARGLDWREGDNVVTTNLEFPSVAYAWRHLESRGVEIRMVPHKNWRVDESDLIDAIDERTRVLAVSHVSFYTGQAHHLDQLSEAARRKGCLFAVDATHSAGVLRVPAGLTDLTVSSAYKWLLTTHGTAACYLSEAAEAQTASTCFGWHNLDVWPKQEAERHATVDELPMPERMEPGNPTMQVIMHLDHSLSVLLNLGVDRIQDHARDLATYTTEGLKKLGFDVMSSSDREAMSGNTTFRIEDAERVVSDLKKKDILLWGEFGRVRVSTHVHNGTADVDRLMDALKVYA